MRVILWLALTLMCHFAIAQSYQVIQDTSVYQLQKFLSKNIRYSANARENEFQGKVIIDFKIVNNGQITDAQIKKGFYAECDSEVLNQFKKYKHRLPLKKGHYKIAVDFVLPKGYGEFESRLNARNASNKDFLFEITTRFYRAILRRDTSI